MFLQPFEGPWLKIERARHHYAEMMETLIDYQARARPVFVQTDREINPWQLEISEPTPSVVACQIGDIAHSLRSALDVMLCDIAVVRNVGLSDMAYPFTADEAQFQEKLALPNHAAPFKKLGQDVVDQISASQPYRHGNVLLRGLHDLNNHDKHRMAVPHISFVSCTLSYGPRFRKDGLDAEMIGGMLAGLGVGEPIQSDWFNGHPSEAYTINDTAMIVCFPQNYVLTGNVITTMGAVIDEIDGLIAKFEALVM